MFSVIENSLNLDTFYLVKLIFGKYFCYFYSNRVAVLLQLQLYLDANRVLVRESANSNCLKVRNRCGNNRVIAESVIGINIFSNIW